MNAEASQDSQEVLHANAAVGCLDTPNHATRDIRALGQLSLG